MFWHITAWTHVSCLTTSPYIQTVKNSQRTWYADIYLQDDVVEADEVLWTGASLVLVGFRFLEFSLQSVGHALIPLHQRTQLDVGQVTGRGEQQCIYYALVMAMNVRIITEDGKTNTLHTFPESFSFVVISLHSKRSWNVQVQVYVWFPVYLCRNCRLDTFPLSASELLSRCFYKNK